MGSPECPSEINNWYYLKNNTEGWTPTAEYDERTRKSIDRMNIMCVRPGCCHKIDVSYNSENPDPEKVNFRQKIVTKILKKFKNSEKIILRTPPTIR